MTTTPDTVPWYRRPWIVPLLVISGAFLVLRVPVYFSFDPADTFIDLKESFTQQHYLVVAFHVFFGTIALATCCLQVWPWLRQRHPKVHRVSGRLYVLAGVLPSGLLGLVASVIAVQTVPGIIGNVMLSLLWLGTTFAGFRAARNRRFQAHRRWMIRSFALCLSIVASRAWAGIWIGVLMPFIDPLYGGDMDALIADSATATIWTSWVVNLLIAEWWLDHRQAKRTPSANREIR